MNSYGKYVYENKYKVRQFACGDKVVLCLPYEDESNGIVGFITSQSGDITIRGDVIRKCRVRWLTRGCSTVVTTEEKAENLRLWSMAYGVIPLKYRGEIKMNLSDNQFAPCPSSRSLTVAELAETASASARAVGAAEKMLQAAEAAACEAKSRLLAAKSKFYKDREVLETAVTQGCK